VMPPGEELVKVQLPKDEEAVRPSRGGGRCQLALAGPEDGRGDEAGQERDGHESAQDQGHSWVGATAWVLEYGVEAEAEERYGDGIHAEGERTEPTGSAATEVTKGYARDGGEDQKEVDGNTEDHCGDVAHGPEINGRGC